jgi:PKD repeat protein
MGCLYLSKLLYNRKAIVLFLFIGLILFSSELSAQCHARFTLPSTACVNASVQFTNTSTGTIDSSYWSWSGANAGDTTFTGNPGLNTIFSNPGLTSVCLTVVDTSSSCTNQTCHNITINPRPAIPAFTYTQGVCSGSPVLLSVTAPVGGMTYRWSFGGSGTIVSHTFTSLGGGRDTIAVMLTDSQNTCTNSVTQNVIINQKPLIVLTDPINNFRFCSGDTAIEIVYDGSTASPGANYNINWGDGSADYSSTTAPAGVSHVYLTGIYPITYTIVNANGCSDTLHQTVYNITNPEIGAANPGNTQACGPKQICFPLNTFSSNDPSTIYTVTYGDGSGTLIYSHPPPDSVCHTYTVTSCGQTGNAYTFTIIASNGCGQSTATIFPVQIYTAPVALFSPSPNPGCTNSAITFTNNTIVGANNSCSASATYLWNFGDGSSPVTTLAKTNETHSYATAGTYTVTLAVHNTCGTSSDTQTVCIEVPPVPGFTASPSTSCSPLVVNFTDASSAIVQCSAITRVWTVTKSSTCIADSASNYVYLSGTNSASLNPVIQFNNQGTYTVTLSLTNACGTFTTAAQTFTVKRQPEVSITGVPATICLGQSISPGASVLSCSGTISAYAWSFPGGSITSSTSPTPGAITYSSAGSNSISLTVTNECGTGSAAASFNVAALPVANAGPNIAYCTGGSGQIGAPAVGGLTYSWTPTVGLNSSTIANPTVTLTAVGSPTVQTYFLTVTNTSTGCSAQSSVVVTVNPKPTISVTPNNAFICFGTGIRLTASGANTYSWSPSGSLSLSASGDTANAHPTTATTYTITGYITATGCSNTTTDVVNVHTLPVVTAPASMQLCNQPIAAQITPAATPAGGVWSGTDITPSGTFTPAGVGSFIETYTYTDGNGCVNSANTTVNVVNVTPANAGPNDTVCQNSAAVHLTGTPAGGAWSGTNVTGAGVFTPSAVGTFPLVYTISAGTTCVQTSTMNMNVNTGPTVVILPSPSTICNRDSITLVASGADTFAWTPTASLTIFPLGDSVHARPTATTTYTVTGVLLSDGCSRSTTTTVTVNPLPIVSTTHNIQLCNQPIPFTLTATATPVGGSGVWTGPNITAGGVFTPNGIGVFTVTYTYTAPNGCHDTATAVINVVAPVYANAGPDSSTCQNNPSVQLTGTPAGGAWSGTIVSGTGLVSTTTPNVYNLVYTISAGGPTCVTRDTMVMTINPQPNVTVSPAAVSICNRDSVMLIASGANTYTWSPNGNITVSVSTDSITAHPTSTTTYTTTGTITATGCQKTATSTVTVKQLPVVTNSPLVQTICSGTASALVTLTSTIAGTTYTWSAVSSGVTGYQASGTSTIPAQTLINADTLVHSISYYIIPTANGCIGDTAVYTIHVKPIPRLIFPAYQTHCSEINTTAVYFYTGVTGTTYTWTGSASAAGVTGFNISGTTDSIGSLYLVNTNPTVQEVTFTVTPTAAGCVGPGAIYVDTVIPIPNTTFSLPVQTVCNDSTSKVVTLTSTTPAVYFQWTATQPAGINGVVTSGDSVIPAQQLTNSTTQSTAIIYYGYATTFNSSCVGPVATYTIAVEPKPTVIATIASDTLCSGIQMNVQLTSNLVNTAYSWTVSAPPAISGASNSNGSVINQILTNYSTVPQQVTYTITPSANGCDGDPIFKTLTINPAAQVHFSIPDQVICSGDTTALVSITSTTSPVTFAWTSIPQPGVSGIAANGVDTIPVQTITNVNHSPVNILYQAYATYDGCQGPDSTYTVTINPTPHVTTPPNIQNICSPDSSSPITLSSDVIGATYTWLSMGGTNLSGFTTSGAGGVIPAQTISNSSILVDTLIYQVTPGFQGCPGPPMDFYIIVRPQPFVSITPDTQVLCSKTGSQVINITSTIAGTTFAWSGTASNVTSSTLTGNTDSIPAHYLENTSPRGDTGFINYTVTSLAAGCAGNPVTAVTMVTPLPIPNFGMAPYTGCSPLSVSVAANAVVFGMPDSLIYIWGDGSPNTTLLPNTLQPIWATISHNFVNHSNLNAANYTITLVGHNQCGDSAISQTVTVLPNTVNAFFTTDVVSGCSPLTVHFQDYSTGGQYSNWCMNFDPVHDSCAGTSLILPSGSAAQETYQAGTYIVALYVTDGCSRDTAFQTITVGPSPIANFTDSSIICQGHEVNFYDQSQGTVLFNGYWWSFGDSTFDINKNTTHGYAQPGIYNVCHSVITADGCKDTVCRNVSVNQSPLVVPNAPADTICSGTQTNITYTSTLAGATYTWTAVAPVYVTGAQNGIGNAINQILFNSDVNPQTVLYIVTPTAAGCPGLPDTISVVVSPSPGVFFSLSPQSVCSGQNSQSIILSSPTGNVNFSWTAVQPFGITGVSTSGTNIIPVQTLANSTHAPVNVNYTAIATSADSRHCVGPQATATITVNPIPFITNSLATQVICSGANSQPVIFTSNVNGSTFAWTNVASISVAGNTPSTGSGDLPAYTLTNNSPTQGYVITTVTPAAAGCPGAAVTDTIFVSPTPVASIAQLPQTVCSGQATVNVNASSTVTGTTYIWSGSAPAGVSGYTANGAGNPIPPQTLSNSTPTPQLVTFTVTPSASGCPGAPITYIDTVNPVPQTLFSLPDQNVCSGSTSSSLTLSSTTPGVRFNWTAVQPAWITGVTTGGTGIIPPQTLTNSTSATITVNYVATATTGGLACPGQPATYAINVLPTPNVSGLPIIDTICSGSATSIQLSSNTAGTLFSWTVAAPAPITGAAAGSGAQIVQTLSNSSPQSKTAIYTVTPIISNCPGPPISLQALVNPSPITNPAPSQSICSGSSSTPITFTSTTPGATYSWSSNANGASGNTPTGNGNLPVQTLTNTLPVIIPVVYSVTASYDNCPGPATQDTIFVKPTPQVTNAPSQTICEGTPTAAVTLTSSISAYPTTYTWRAISAAGVTGYPVSGTTATIPSFTPSNPNDTISPVVYSVVPTSLGCPGPAFDYTVFVKPVPVASPIPADTVCSGGNLLVNLHSDVAGTIFNWTVTPPPSLSGASSGSGTAINQNIINSTMQMQQLTYTVTPSYLFCTGASVSFTVYVQPAPDIQLPGVQTICSGQSITPVSISSSVPGVYFTWTASGLYTTGFYLAGRGNIPSQTLIDTNHTLDGQVDYHVVPNIGSCAGLGTDYIVNVNHAPLSDFTFAGVCVNSQPSVITNLSVGGNYYLWYFGDGTSSILQNPQHTYPSAATYSITLIVTSAAGCSDTAYRAANVFAIPHANFTLPALNYCNAPQTITMQNTSTGASVYAWSFGNGDVSTLFSPTETYSAVGSYPVQLIASNTFNCNDTIVQTINFNKQPIISAIDVSPGGCQPRTVTLTAQQQNSVYYLWNFGDGTTLLDSTGTSVTHIYPDSGTYSVTLHAYANNSCLDSLYLNDTIKVLLVPTSSFAYTTADTIIGAGAPVTFINHSHNGSTFTWDFGNGQSSSDSAPVYRYPDFGTYSIMMIATAADGCSDTSYGTIDILGGHLFVPNAFAPEFVGGSDLAKVWKPSGFGLSSYHAQIFNTYGELLWESDRLTDTEPADAWDGTYRGSAVQQDVYVWKIDATFLNGSRWTGMSYKGSAPRTMGDVTVIR